jgi:hypothetical protein
MVERESGTVNRARRLTDVTNPPTDRQEKIVHWVSDAWYMIQTGRNDWSFLFADVATVLVPGQRAYAPAAMGIADLDHWVTDRTDYLPWTVEDVPQGFGPQALRQIPYDTYRQRYDRGTPQLQAPTEYAIGRDGAFHVGSAPDRAYALRGEYRRLPQRLALNGDVPIAPQQFHDAIAWRALILLGEHDEAPVLIATARAKFQPLFNALVQRCTPPVEIPGGDRYF